MAEGKRMSAREYARSQVPPLNERTLQTLAKTGQVAGAEYVAKAYVAFPAAWQAAWENRNTKKGPKPKKDPSDTPQ